MRRFTEDLYPVEWAGAQAVVTLPEHIGISNAGQVREELLSVINRGARTLIVHLDISNNAPFIANPREFGRAMFERGVEVDFVDHDPYA